MLAGAAERYANEFGILPGQKVALFVNNDAAYRAASTLRRAGAEIAAIVGIASVDDDGKAAPLRQRAQLRGVTEELGLR